MAFFCHLSFFLSSRRRRDLKTPRKRNVHFANPNRYLLFFNAQSLQSLVPRMTKQDCRPYEVPAVPSLWLRTIYVLRVSDPALKNCILLNSVRKETKLNPINISSQKIIYKLSCRIILFQHLLKSRQFIIQRMQMRGRYGKQFSPMRFGIKWRQFFFYYG